MSEGLDVYGRYNTITSWSQVNGAKDFVYIKVTDGMTTANGVGRTYDYGYVASARGSGLPTGGYHYAQLGNAVQQANFFIDRCVALGATDLAPLLDLESPFVANQTATDFAIAFLNQVRARGFKPALYGNNSMLSVVRAPVKAAIPETIIVVARYGANPTVPWDVWQFTSSGACAGVAGNVDLDTGIVPLNGGTVATLDNDDHTWIIAHQTDWWYGPRFKGNSNFAQVFFNMRDTVRGLTTSLTALTNLVTSNEANDVTAATLAAALVPAILPQLEQGIHDAVAGIADVNLTPEQVTAIANATATAFGAKLSGA